MSALPPKAEVAIDGADVRFVPFPEVAMPAVEPSTASKADIADSVPEEPQVADKRRSPSGAVPAPISRQRPIRSNLQVLAIFNPDTAGPVISYYPFYLT